MLRQTFFIDRDVPLAPRLSLASARAGMRA
jgi:hypothetical protein